MDEHSFPAKSTEQLPQQKAEDAETSNLPRVPQVLIGDSPDAEPDEMGHPPLSDAGLVETEQQVSQQPSLNYPVVAIGSSAGGLQPLKEILAMLPPDTGMAFVLVPHLAPDQVSHLKEITEHYTRMPVHSIRDGEQPAKNNVYVLQPNEIAQIQAGRFIVTARNPEDRTPHSIDTFFRSLGEDLQSNAIGVVLSGADADGSLGLKSIRGQGGVAIVQTPETAQHSSMPQSSISADHVDIVLSPQEIGVELARLSRQFARPDVQVLEHGKEAVADRESFQRILQMLRTNSGLELRQYKPDTIRRRIGRRMMLLRMETLADYTRYLQARKDELTNLQEDVLIGVTRFFRDPGFWHALSSDILPTFFQDGGPQRPVRIWCAGCSSGEEVYSFAITFLEYMTAHGLDNTIQIFGTDASERSIEMARLGVYPDSLISEIGPERLRRFFTKVDHGYQLNKRVRDACIFAKQNLCTDPPFSHIDFLACRNVLIYFNQSLQRQVMQTFHYALEPSGYLLLGSSETLRDYDEWFNTIDRKNKIYGKLGNSMPGGYHFPTHRLTSSFQARSAETTEGDQVWSELELQRAGDRVVVARFAPPGLIIDERLNVLQVRGQTSPYVQLASGTVSWNLSRVVREEIAAVVRDTTQHAISENVPVSALATLEENGKSKQLHIDILPLSQKSSQHRCFMVLFREVDELAAIENKDRSAPSQLGEDEKERLIAHLRADLTSTRFHLQSLIGERDARNQELVSANEEIQSANEELQSTNEELETTKEELQSANEEMQTVNDELQQRNAVLTQTGNDLNNLLTSVNIPLLMLTDKLEIRQFTPPMEKLLNIRSTDIGRLISEIRLQLSIENIDPILREVLETLGTREVEVQDRFDKWHLLRVRPYRTSDNKIEGLVIVLVDTDQLRKSQHELRDARNFADSIVSSIPIPVVVLEADCTIRLANTEFCELTQLASRELTGRSLPDLVRIKWGIDGFLEKLQTLIAAEPGAVLQFEHKSNTADHKILLIKGQALPRDGSRAVVLTMEDITQQRDAEQTLGAQKQVLELEIALASERLTNAQKELHELAAHLFHVQEGERQRIARELHDDIAQRLTALSLDLGHARREAESSKQSSAMDLVAAQIESLSRDVRHLSHRLHPAILDDLGLVPALNALVTEFRDREAMFATYLGTDVPDHVPRTASTAIYRVTQEALRNVAKHAGKTHVKVILERRGERLRLEVRDFGIGFDKDGAEVTGGLGLISMKERARIAGGTFQVVTDLGQGTSIIMEVPIAEPE